MREMNIFDELPETSQRSRHGSDVPEDPRSIRMMNIFDEPPKISPLSRHAFHGPEDPSASSPDKCSLENKPKNNVSGPERDKTACILNSHRRVINSFAEICDDDIDEWYDSLAFNRVKYPVKNEPKKNVSKPVRDKTSCRTSSRTKVVKSYAEEDDFDKWYDSVVASQSEDPVKNVPKRGVSGSSVRRGKHQKPQNNGQTDVPGKVSWRSVRRDRRPKPPKKHQCSDCEKRFSCLSELTAHRRKHTGIKPFRCPICKKLFPQKGARDKHLRNHNDEDRFQCKFCDKVFSQKGNCEIHQRIHTKEKPFPCTLCGSSFRSGSDLSKHSRVHSGEKPFSCTVCDKTFYSSYQLKSHLPTHTGEKTAQCPICQKSFHGKGYISIHMRTHTGEKPYQCPICQKRFARAGLRQTHMQTHTGKKPFRCTECGKGFFLKKVLERHVITHTGEKPHRCTVCPDRFKDRITLKRHMLKHDTEKQCSVCQEIFASVHDLTEHKKTHPEKLFQCKECEKRFSYQSGLKRHLISHTKEKPFMCDICGMRFSYVHLLKRHMKKPHSLTYDSEDSEDSADDPEDPSASSPEKYSPENEPKSDLIETVLEKSPRRSSSRIKKAKSYAEVSDGNDSDDCNASSSGKNLLQSSSQGDVSDKARKNTSSQIRIRKDLLETEST